MSIEKITNSIKFEKNYRIYEYDISDEKISFHYNDKIMNRIKVYFNNGLVDKLVDLKLLTVSHLVINNQKKKNFKVLQPEFVMPYMLHELTPGMRKNAAKLILRLSLELDKYNLMIAEGSLTRIFFNKNRQPFYYDIAGIVEKKDVGFYYSSFNKSYLNFLRIICLKPQLINLVQPLNKIEFSDYLTICSPVKYKIINVLFSIIGKNKTELKLNLLNSSPAMTLLLNFRINLFFDYSFKFFKKNKRFKENFSKIIINDLLTELESMNSFEIIQKWTDYYEHINFNEILNDNKNWKSKFDNERENSIIKIISNKKYKTLLDIGANGGYFSIISGLIGLNTVAMDNDVGALQLLYNNLENNKPLPIIPVVKSFTSISEHELIRFKSDVVLALGFIHHMRLVELLSWEIIAERLYSLTNNILIIEFKSDTLARGDNDWGSDEAVRDYSTKSLIDAFSKFFSSIKKVGEFSALDSDSKRHMFVCKR